VLDAVTQQSILSIRLEIPLWPNIKIKNSSYGERLLGCSHLTSSSLDLGIQSRRASDGTLHGSTAEGELAQGGASIILNYLKKCLVGHRHVKLKQVGEYRKLPKKMLG
jgi:hypothetical protein